MMAKVKQELEHEIIFNFFLWFRENGEKYVNLSVEKMIGIYLQQSK